jgi:predicted GNAT family acetyltransferase
VQQLPIEVARRLGPADAEAVRRLIASQADGPDAFHPGQLRTGSFFGIWQAEELISMAGTHVLSEEFSVAAVGNVFTHPDHRRLGHGRTVSAAVLQDLTERSIKTIVLNVHPGNQTAVRLYHELGFLEYCRYIEGVGEWSVEA